MQPDVEIKAGGRSQSRDGRDGKVRKIAEFDQV
jgi:hypothetical protein